MGRSAVRVTFSSASSVGTRDRLLSRTAESCSRVVTVLENESRLVGGAGNEGRASALRAR
jgi:hypothetical protein